ILRLQGDFSYNITMNDANVGFGQTLTVNAGPLGAGQYVYFDGFSEFDGAFNFFDSSGNDVFYGSWNNDHIFMGHGGDDYVWAGFGDDIIHMKDRFTSNDQIDGAEGVDTVILNGDYGGSQKVVFNSTTMIGVERLNLTHGHSYDLTTDD